MKSKKTKSSKILAKQVSAEVVVNEEDKLINPHPENLPKILSKDLIVIPEKGVSTTDPLMTYLNEIRKYPVLTKEKENEIAIKYFENKDPEAAELLVKSNLRFVVKVAAEYSKFGAKMIDLIQEGNIGLLHALKEYNPYKGARLITYAVWWIKGYIQEYLMKQYSMVKIGTTQNQKKLFYQLKKNKELLESLSGSTDFTSLSEQLGIPEDEVREMAQRLSGRDVSLDQPVSSESTTQLIDLQKSPNGDSSSESLDDIIDKKKQLQFLSEKVKEIRSSLTAKELIILDERILNEEPLTLQEIGDKYKITREAVRQMETRIVKKIKNMMDEM